MICWISFNQHKNPENRYKKLLLLFKPFQKSEFNFQNNCDSWKNAFIYIYIYIEKKWKKNVYNLNPSNNSNIEWDNLEWQVKE
jgi:hypothetical protein